MVILHANWSDGHVRLWGESLERFGATRTPATDSAHGHPFAAHTMELADALIGDGLLAEEHVGGRELLHIKLPLLAAGDPCPSNRLASMLGKLELPVRPELAAFTVASLRLANEHAIAALLTLEDQGPTGELRLGHSLRYWITVARFVQELLADQRFIPTLIHTREGGLRAGWRPWLHDREIRGRVGALIASMPAIARAADNGADSNRPWPILSEAMSTLTDATVRSILARERFAEAIDELDPASDPHVAWLAGLLGKRDDVAAVGENGDMLHHAGLWVSRLDETEREQTLRLCLRLGEPGVDADAAEAWRLSFHLQASGEQKQLFDAETVWSQPAAISAASGGASRGAEQPQEIFLAQLGRAARIYPRLETALNEPAPTGIDLTLAEAYEFLTEHKPVLEESGIRTIAPEWWSQPSSRLGARLLIDSPPLDSNGTSSVPRGVGLHSIVNYRWQVAIGDHPLTLEELQRLAAERTPLVRIRGQWIEIRQDDMSHAAEFLAMRPGGEMTLLEAIRTAYSADDQQPGRHASPGVPGPALPVVGLDATGWVGDLLAASSDVWTMGIIEQAPNFHGTLRPYQKTGLSWLAFLDRFGLGACLADDMGLGKTIQLIALLLHERQPLGHVSLERESASVGPTLLIVPTSVVSNWVREIDRFAPSLRVHVHHGPERPMDSGFVAVAGEVDVIITTYALAARDRDTLTRVAWHRVALDEAQYIKNPPTKQTAAIRALSAGRRVALTGTPVENRLSELWSIMEFCNPGFLGPAQEFRSRYAIPVERHRDQRRAAALRNLVRPFILRRLKTDPRVISDLPPLVESKEFAMLTPEQAALYEQAVRRMLVAVDDAEGIQRRGLVLATLVKLKQICNHPLLVISPAASLVKVGKVPGAESLLGGTSAIEHSSIAIRSGKSRRLLELVEEVLATGERALIFTQFRRMGHLLTAMIRAELDCEALFLHGGTPQDKRQQMIDRFQDPSSDSPIFVLSLRAGGVGLNLTAANHVFHFDRWWNPAVENQATDRAFRIGQTRTVHVHKFVCAGTLEERIDQMIEEKTELAKNIIGTGEQWLTELSTAQLRDMLTLRRLATEVET
jgi:SNF2 family DNA or RNA helicase